MSPVLGKVTGARCPHCKAEVELNETFHEGQEYECPECKIQMEIAFIAATYKVKLRLLLGARPRSRCVECSELKDDPEDFYDGLRCRECAEQAERAEP